MRTEKRLRLELSSMSIFENDDSHSESRHPRERKQSAEHRVEDTPEPDSNFGASESSSSDFETDVLRDDSGYGKAPVVEEGVKGKTSGLKPMYTRILKRSERSARETA